MGAGQQEKTPESAHSYIQWKGTDVCLDFHCECGWHGHYDGDFAYYLRCKQCKAIYRTGETVAMTKLTDPEEIKEHAKRARQPQDDDDDNAAMTEVNLTAGGTDAATRNREWLKVVQEAAKLIEGDGIDAYRTVSQRFGEELARILIVVHLRRGHGAMDTFPADPAIDAKVATTLEEERILLTKRHK